MSTNTDFDRRTAAWLADGPTELNDRVLDAALREVHLTSQRRRWSTSWRINRMPNNARLVAAIAIVSVVGAGALFYVNRPPGVGAPPTPSPPATAAPTPVASGIMAWKTYTSDVYGFVVGYPDDWTVFQSATREWQPGDSLGVDAPYADMFASPEEDTIGLLVWQMPGEPGADVASLEDLEAWAEGFCNDMVKVSCAGIPDRAEQVCIDGRDCHLFTHFWLIVPWPEQQFAFFPDQETGEVTVVVVGREDGYPSAARYGGSLALLKAILPTVNARPSAPEVPATAGPAESPTS